MTFSWRFMSGNDGDAITARGADVDHGGIFEVGQDALSLCQFVSTFLPSLLIFICVVASL